MQAVDDLAALEAALARESNAALARGALVTAALGVLGAVAVPLVGFRGPHAWPPAIFGLTASLFSLSLWVLARRGRVRGAIAWAAMLTFVSLPTAFFALAAISLDTGAATYIHGPIAWVYFVCIAVSGCLFRARLSIACGAVASIGYALSFAMAHPILESLVSGDESVTTDILSWPISFIRILMLLAAGGVVGGLATLARRLTLRVLAEERDKEQVSRLLGEYVSEEVKAKLLSAPLGEGERKHVVILFSDVRGFTQASEAADPEALVRRLNEYFDAMVDAIGGEGGVVDKFVGDAVMAVFGGVLDLPDPEAAAVRAALRMRASLAVLREQWAGQSIPPFDNGIGIHAGEVLQGAIGARHRKDYTVIGDAVNTASRVEGLTKEHGQPILITSTVHARLPTALAAQCTALGPVTVKGRVAALELYAVAATPT